MLDRLRPDRVPNRDATWYAADALLALMLGYFTIESMRGRSYVEEYGQVQGLGWALVLGPTALILVRRSAPATAMAAATAFYLLAGLDHGDGNSILAVPFLTYMVGLTRPPKVSALMVAVAAVLVSLTACFGPGPVIPVAVVVVWVLHAIGWAVGVRMRHTQDRAAELAAEAEAARVETVEASRRAVADERARIARELHDAVGHAVNVMVMQAGAARLTTTDERTVGSLREIERVGRSALADLDRMLGLLRSDEGEAAPLEPAHGIRDIVTLVAGVRAAGADVHLDDGCGDALDLAVERPIGAAAYRIVQESLTNAVKHAGPARIDVVLSCEATELVVRVADDGRGAAASPTRGGRGLAGMKERVAVLGGTLTAGPRAGGGFAVEAHLPRTEGHR